MSCAEKSGPIRSGWRTRCGWRTLLIDKLGLYTVEAALKSREDVILRQQQELLELSTPVVRLWDGILACR